jgi:hypothetical protein
MALSPKRDPCPARLPSHLEYTTPDVSLRRRAPHCLFLPRRPHLSRVLRIWKQSFRDYRIEHPDCSSLPLPSLMPYQPAIARLITTFRDSWQLSEELSLAPGGSNRRINHPRLHLPYRPRR